MLWLTPDSIVPNIYKPIAWNPYAFNYNNPVNYVDPSGHIPLALLGAVLLGAAVSTAVDYTVVSHEAGQLASPWQYMKERGWKTAVIGGVSGALSYYLIPAAGLRTVAVVDELLGVGSSVTPPGAVWPIIRNMALNAGTATVIDVVASASMAGAINVGQNWAMRSWVTGEGTELKDVRDDFLWGSLFFAAYRGISAFGKSIKCEAVGRGVIIRKYDGPRFGNLYRPRVPLSVTRRVSAMTLRTLGWVVEEFVDLFQSGSEVLLD